MSQIYVSKIAVINNGWQDERYLVWEEGKFNQPLALLMRDELVELRDAISSALKLPMPRLGKK